jgi:hypothetical protein
MVWRRRRQAFIFQAGVQAHMCGAILATTVGVLNFSTGVTMVPLRPTGGKRTVLNAATDDDLCYCLLLLIILLRIRVWVTAPLDCVTSIVCIRADLLENPTMKPREKKLLLIHKKHKSPSTYSYNLQIQINSSISPPWQQLSTNRKKKKT